MGWAEQGRPGQGKRATQQANEGDEFVCYSRNEQALATLPVLAA